MLKNNPFQFKRDLLILILSSIAAYYLLQNTSINSLFEKLAANGSPAYALIVGFFFTSAFTTVPAIATLIKMAQFFPVIQVAFFGALGAVAGDAIIFFFMRDRLIKDLIKTLKKNHATRLRHLLKSKIIRYSLTIIGGILIALPLPTDEAAFTLMSLSKIKNHTFFLIAFTFNFAAIVVFSKLASHWF